MKFIALVSGGKDSILSIAFAIKNGHELVALAHIAPVSGDEQDSYMYQSVGTEIIPYIAEAISVPYYTLPTISKAYNKSLQYTPTKDDEVETLFQLLTIIVAKHPEVNAVSSGAILSEYQKNRVEDVCHRLGLHSLAYLWKKSQNKILECGLSWGMNAILVKVCSLGLSKQHLGKSLKELKDYLYDLNKKYGVSICGEGGEYETAVLDCPLYKKEIKIKEVELVTHDAKSDVYYLKLKFELIDKKFSEPTVLDDLGE